MKHPVITLLTDFGTRDAFVGAMKGVILSICPQARLVDLTHEVPPQNIGAGAFLLKSAAGFFPKGTVHLAVVDPGVGSSRKAVALRNDGHYFVGPDNGFFPAALGAGIEECVEVTETKYHLPNPSPTFHGRDLFAPVAAHLAAGTALSKLGKRLSRLVPGRIPAPRKSRKGWEGEVLWVDRFGNLITNFRENHLSSGSCFKVGGKAIRRRASHYAQVKPLEALALVGSSGNVEISVRLGRADKKFKAGIGERILLYGEK